jgi:predicted Rossmann-fold nucleotide-binding protein
MQPLIYVAGPYRAATRDAIAKNIDAARVIGISAAALGWFPVIPHANTAHMELDLPELGDDFWLRGTMAMMERCDAVVLVPGWENSAGTKAEMARADALRIPIFRNLDTLPSARAFIEWLSANETRASRLSAAKA